MYAVTPSATWIVSKSWPNGSSALAGRVNSAARASRAGIASRVCGWRRGQYGGGPFASRAPMASGSACPDAIIRR